MALTSYPSEPAIGFAGQIASLTPHRIKTVTPIQNMPAGVGVAYVYGSDKKEVRLPVPNICTITVSSGTWTAGNASVTVNGDTVTVTYDTDKATTLTALATAIEARPGVLTAVSAALTITITAIDPNETLVIGDLDLTSITGTMTLVSTLYTTSDSLAGITVRDYTSANNNIIYANNIYDKATITISGDTITTSDIINCTVNGVAISAVTYATSELATLGEVAARIEIIAGVTSATVSGRVITVTSHPNYQLTVSSFVITDNALASVAPTAAIVGSKQDITSTTNETTFIAGQYMPMMKAGEIYVEVTETVTTESTVYWRYLTSGTKQPGTFGDSADTSTAVAVTTANYDLGAASGGIAKIELNLP